MWYFRCADGKLNHGGSPATARARPLIVLACVLLGLGALPTSATAVSPLPPEDPTVQAASVASLVSNEGVSVDQASADLALQDAAGPLLDSIDAAIGPAATGDDWLDLHRARLEIAVVSSANPPSGPNVDNVRALLAGSGLLSSADFVPVRFSSDELMTAQAGLDQQLVGLETAGEVSTAIDPETNSVTVDEASGVDPSDDAIIRNAVASMTVPTTRRVDSATDMSSDALGCAFHSTPTSPTPNWLMCDPPLRGGVTIDDSAGLTGVGCTLGFNARGAGIDSRIPLNSRAVLTAGHCIVLDRQTTIDGSVRPWRSYDESGHPHQVRAAKRYPNYIYDYSANGDWAAMVNGHTAYWQPTAEIYAGHTAQDYAIATDGTTKKNWTVCMTSAIPLSTAGTDYGLPDPAANEHSTCGQVKRLNQTACNANIYPVICVEHLIRTNIRQAVPGSSGGPVFRRHVGLGLVVSVQGGQMLFQAIKPVERRAGAYIFAL